MNAYYSEELFDGKGDDMLPGMARRDGEIIRIVPMTEGSITGMSLLGTDIVALVELYINRFDSDEIQRIRKAMNESEALGNAAD